MSDYNLPNNFYADLQKLSVRYAGVYLINKFFIRIVTDKRKADIPSYNYNDNSFSDDDQMMLQRENYPTLFHEYIHYIHEVSTMAGITQFYLNIVNRSIFSEFVRLPDTSIPLPVSGEKKLMFDKINRTLEAATGGSLHDLDDRLVFRIDHIDLFDFPAYEPSRDLDAPIKVPMITYSYLNEATGKEAQDSVYFGKYFIYEGLAHHLDQVVTAQLNRPLTPKRLVKPEYKLLELIARYYFPGIDERSMLELASMSLCYFNCGQRFIRMIEEAADVPYLSGFVMGIHNEVYDHFKEHEEEIKFTLEEIKEIFAKRAGMHAAASHLCDVMLNAYEQRMKRPTFEIDIIYSGHLKEMRSFVDLCDMVYELADEDKYMRDYAGTYLPNQLASDLQIFLCHVDYFQTSVAEVEEHCCPLYTFCPHRIRQEKPEQCAKTPRLAYEDHVEYGWCHYGRGIAYMTGQDVA
ncbi:MAG: hypothetical protein JWP94_2702 [Mucilaginibacter sp.]|nr:hypothetical protein [Mucilaginibacter sp.]